MFLSNEENIQKLIEHSNCYNDGQLIDGSVLTSNLRLGQSVHYDAIKQEWVIDRSIGDIATELKDEAVEKRFGDIEFALDEEGRPDGIKNKQEMVLTIASDIANSIGEMAFEEVKQLLEEDDWVDTKAMELLKESKEK